MTDLITRLRGARLYPLSNYRQLWHLCDEAAEALEIQAKPLVWVDTDYNLEAETPLGLYSVFNRDTGQRKLHNKWLQVVFTDSWGDRNHIVLGYESTEGEAKELCEADWQYRFRRMKP